MFNEKDLIIKENYFLYKGNAYTYDKDIIYDKLNYLENQDTKEEYLNSINDFFFLFNCNSENIPENTLLKIKTKYFVKMNGVPLEFFNTEEEAKYFINLITNKKEAE